MSDFQMALIKMNKHYDRKYTLRISNTIWHLQPCILSDWNIDLCLCVIGINKQRH